MKQLSLWGDTHVQRLCVYKWKMRKMNNPLDVAWWELKRNSEGRYSITKVRRPDALYTDLYRWWALDQAHRSLFPRSE